jgi:hypothetical protein
MDKSENLSSEPNVAEINEKNVEEVKFPLAEGVLELYRKEFPSDKAGVERLKDILYRFFRIEFENIKMYQSGKFGAKFLNTKINIAQLAREIYSQVMGSEINEMSLEKVPDRRTKREFVFTSFLTPTNGNPFTFAEEAAHQCIKYLPAALEDLKNGKQPDDIEIHTLGAPTNIFSEMSDEFYEEFMEDPYGHLSKVYAELVKQELADCNPRETNVEFFGLSMGANFAVLTGENLLEEGAVTQNIEDLEEGKKPRLFIRVESPVSLGPSKIKKLQIPLGFMADSAVLLATKPYNRRTALGEGKFINDLKPLLSEKGVEEISDDKQKKMRKKALRNLVFSLVNEVKPEPETRVTKVYGTKDLAIYTPDLIRSARKHRKSYRDALGKTIIPGKSKNERNFAVNMGHVRPFFHKRELGRMKKLVAVVDSLAENS